MKKIVLAESAGFCFGVKRAMDKVEEKIRGSEGFRKIYTYGPIIHNSEVVEDLKSKGVSVINTPDEIRSIAGQTMIIRSHGVSKDIYELAGDNDIDLVDATCPFVKKIHDIVKEKSREGYHIVIIGDAAHPEVQGIMGWCENACDVVKNREELSKIPLKKERRYLLVAQTTFNFLEIGRASCRERV